MYVKTGRVMEELAKAFPIMNEEEIIDILIEKVQKGNKTTVNRDKWRSGVYILMYDEPCTALTNVLKKSRMWIWMGFLLRACPTMPRLPLKEMIR